MNETLYWFDILEASGVCNPTVIKPLRTEADELLRVFSTSLDTAKRNAGR